MAGKGEAKKSLTQTQSIWSVLVWGPGGQNINMFLWANDYKSDQMKPLCQKDHENEIKAKFQLYKTLYNMYWKHEACSVVCWGWPVRGCSKFRRNESETLWLCCLPAGLMKRPHLCPGTRGQRQPRSDHAGSGVTSAVSLGASCMRGNFISAGGRGASLIIICCLGYMSQCETLSSLLECSTGGATPHGWWNEPLMHAWQLKAASGAGLRWSLFYCSIVPIHWSQDPPAASGNVKVFM